MEVSLSNLEEIKKYLLLVIIFEKSAFKDAIVNNDLLINKESYACQVQTPLD